MTLRRGTLTVNTVDHVTRSVITVTSGNDQGRLCARVPADKRAAIKRRENKDKSCGWDPMNELTGHITQGASSTRTAPPPLPSHARAARAARAGSGKSPARTRTVVQEKGVTKAHRVAIHPSPQFAIPSLLSHSLFLLARARPTSARAHTS